MADLSGGTAGKPRIVPERPIANPRLTVIRAATSAAVIPCLNEARTIARVVAAVRSHVPMVIVVDDGSTDATAGEAASAGAVVVRHNTPQGKGAALATGWSRAAADGFTWVLLLDGDDQHAPGDIPGFFDAAARTGARLVVGNRFAHPAPMPWTRRLTNRWMSARLSRLAGVPLPDSQCGFRLAEVAALTGLRLQARNYQIESEMVVAFARAGHRVEFVPIEVRYGGERSKIAPLRDGWRWWLWYREARRQPRRGMSPVQGIKRPPTDDGRGLA